MPEAGLSCLLADPGMLQAEAPCSVKSHGYADVLAASAPLGL